ncbi:MAG: hypothetical protein GY854_26865 [Deltaproteobacteria bacterium]|nr:hypothetical protein [Deltaproteobacteria bacterium]
MRANNPTKLSMAAMTFVVFVICSGPSAASELLPEGWGPTNGITLGPSAGWVGGGPVESATAVGLEASYFHQIVFPLYFWVSGGGRLWIEDNNLPVLPYIETGLGILLLNLGVGYSIGLNTPGSPSHNIHVFVGLNAPIWSPAKLHVFFIEPYYRPSWNISGGGQVSHEVGGILKWCMGFM